LQRRPKPTPGCSAAEEEENVQKENLFLTNKIFLVKKVR
jgi:hypothetical protein